MNLSSAMEIAANFPGLLRLHKDGSVLRYFSAPYAAPSPDHPDPETSVFSKDITLSSSSSTIPARARVYLPSSSAAAKLPVILYFHGGGFCVESAFSVLSHRYVNHLAAATSALIISIDYRLAPEHPLPTAYSDTWAALQWVASHSDPDSGDNRDPWVAAHADFEAFFVGGDSAGANIAHNLVIRAGGEDLPGGAKINGAFLCHSYFIDSSCRADLGPIVEGKWSTALSYKVWEIVYPGAVGGPSNPMIDPVGPGAPSLAKLGCARVLVAVGEEDELRDVNVKYYEAVRGSGYGGEVEIEVVEGEGHAFQVFDPVSANARVLLRRLGCFVGKK